MEKVDTLAEMLRKAGIEPKEIWHEEMEHDAGINIDGVYDAQICPYEAKQYHLSKWVDGGKAKKDIDSFKTPQQLVDRYLLDVKYQIR
jgi:hypothetical protein